MVDAVLLLDHVGHRVVCTLSPVKCILVKAVLRLLILVVTWLLLLRWSLLFDAWDVVVQTKSLGMHLLASISHVILSFLS